MIYQSIVDKALEKEFKMRLTFLDTMPANVAIALLKQIETPEGHNHLHRKIIGLALDEIMGRFQVTLDEHLEEHNEKLNIEAFFEALSYLSSYEVASKFTTPFIEQFYSLLEVSNGSGISESNDIKH